MLDSSYKYTSRQWVLISFLGVVIITSLLFIFDYSDLSNQIGSLTSGKGIQYVDTVKFPNIDELNGLFPDEKTDNVELQEEVKALSITPTLTLTPSPTRSITPTPTSIINKAPPTATPTILPTTILPTTIIVRDYSVPWPVSPGCPISTLKCVPCLLGEKDCRVEVGETLHGFKGWSCQNNNPGNIRPADFKNDIIENNGGTAPCGKRTASLVPLSEYMVFSDYYTGLNALKAYIKGINDGEHSSYQGTVLGTYYDCGECPLTFFFDKYAPDTNPYDLLSIYAERVATRLNISSSTYLSWVVENKLDEFVNAIQIQEGFFVQ